MIKPSISHLAQQRENALRRQYHALERILKVVLRENRVRDECLEIALRILERYANLTVFNAQETIDEIKRRLAELEPEEKTDNADESTP